MIVHMKPKIALGILAAGAVFAYATVIGIGYAIIRLVGDE